MRAPVKFELSGAFAGKHLNLETRGRVLERL